MPFQPATKRRANLRLALEGPAGSGKTWTALELAKWLIPNGRTALIDSEHGSASLYANDFRFDHAALPNYSVEAYCAEILEAQERGYDILIIDSLSHAWFAPGGVLDFKDKMAEALHGDAFRAWGKATPLQNSLIEALLTYKGHLIATMRTKTEYVVEQVEEGGKIKNKPKKMGLAPIQRDGVDYEFDVIMRMEEGTGVVTKTRCTQLTGYTCYHPGKELADVLRAWVTEGAEPLWPKLSEETLVLLRQQGKQRLADELVPQYYPSGAAIRETLQQLGFADYDPLQHEKIKRMLIERAGLPF